MNFYKHMESQKIIEDKIEYTFKEKSLLLDALTHPSNKSKRTKSYQRLEFLGDKILSFIITKELFFHFPEYSEHLLSKHHNFLVSRKFLSKMAKEINIDQAIIISKGEEKCLGRSRESNLADACEALLGAIYIDSNLIEVERVVLRFWKKYIHDKECFQNFDPKSELQEFTQKYYSQTPEYILLEKQGEDHDPKFRIKVQIQSHNATGEGRSKKEAQEKAAKNFLLSHKDAPK